MPKLDLSLDLSQFSDLEGGLYPDAEGQGLGYWTGAFEGVPFKLEFSALDRAQFTGFSDSGDVAAIVSFNRGNRAREKGGSFEFEVSRALEGKFGYVPYGWFAVDEFHEGTMLSAHHVVVAGLTPGFGYLLEIDFEAPLSSELLDGLAAWASASIVYGGEVLDPQWSDGEALERWEANAPDEILKKLKKRKKKPQIIRTKYYIIFTDLGKSTAGSFGEAVDKNYETIRSIFPFDDVPGERLLPIFYFNQREHYLDWWVKNLGGSRESAERSGGVASGDVYATHHQAVNEPVHIHEQTHQIFRNRLRLSGGGSWFQEGVAEYMGSKPGDLGEIKRYASKEGGLDPFETFMVVPSLLMSSAKGGRKEGGSNAGLAYNYAGAIIEFAKHSKFGEDKFLEWVHAMGQVARGDLPAIRAAVSRVYGVTLEEFEAEFRKYWKKRRTVKKWHSPAPKPKKASKG